jgi:hypothetical protein
MALVEIMDENEYRRHDQFSNSTDIRSYGFCKENILGEVENELDG